MTIPTIDNIFLALADPTRRAVLQRLGEGDASVSELHAPFNTALPSFMKHIAMLENAAMISTKKEGRVRTCSLNPQTLDALENWVTEQRSQWASRHQKLDTLLSNLKRPRPLPGKHPWRSIRPNTR